MSQGRPNLRRSYKEDIRILPTMFQKVALGAALLAVTLMGMGWLWIDTPIVWLLGNTWLNPVTLAMIFAVAALGLNILTGVTGQVSLGHAFFMGVGAYTAVALGGKGDGWQACVPYHEELGLLERAGDCGLGLPIWIWLPMAAAVAAGVGILVAPVAVKVRGLYLAIVTIGLVFIGLHVARMFPNYAGDYESGRKWPKLEFRFWKEETPIIDLDSDGKWFGFLQMSEEQKQFFFMLGVLLLALWMAKNLVRSRTGRALQAIRDRDVAAEVMGVPEFEYKRLGFAISSAYAGLAGALWGAYSGRVSPVDFSLTLSVEFIAILLIGGSGTVAGTMMGAFFVRLTPEVVKKMTDKLADQLDGGILEPLANVLLNEGKGDLGPITLSPTAPGWEMSVFRWNLVIYGVLVIVFLIFEPLGLYGIWSRIRNYWKGWPFSY